jgi:hypothetical protein
MKRKCSKCNGEQDVLKSTTPEGFIYDYYKCKKCGEEILDMNQLHAVAEQYRKMKKHKAKLTPWGKSIGLRIPKELAKKYKFKNEVTLIEEENGVRIVA